MILKISLDSKTIWTLPMSSGPISPTQSTRLMNRSHFVGGSDARIIMGKDEKALARLKEKRGELNPPDFMSELIVQLGLVTEDLNRRWYEVNSNCHVSHIQRHVSHRT